MSRVFVRVIEGKEIVEPDAPGASCYVFVKYNGARKRTKRIDQEYSPRWDQTIKFNLDDDESTVKIRVYNTKQRIGHVKVSFNPQNEQEQIFEEKLPRGSLIFGIKCQVDSSSSSSSSSESSESTESPSSSSASSVSSASSASNSVSVSASLPNIDTGGGPGGNTGGAPTGSSPGGNNNSIEMSPVNTSGNTSGGPTTSGPSGNTGGNTGGAHKGGSGIRGGNHIGHGSGDTHDSGCGDCDCDCKCDCDCGSCDCDFDCGGDDDCCTIL